jgi:hypothetical protein
MQSVISLFSDFNVEVTRIFSQTFGDTKDHPLSHFSRASPGTIFRLSGKGKVSELYTSPKGVSSILNSRDTVSEWGKFSHYRCSPSSKQRGSKYE